MVREHIVLLFYFSRFIVILKCIWCIFLIQLFDDRFFLDWPKFFRQPVFFGWGFNLPRGQPLRDVWAKIPSDTEILITHGPPVGFGDETRDGNRAGCVDLLNTIQNRVKPKLHIFGHIHEGYGVTKDTNGTLFINASTCTIRYKATNPPIIIDLPIKDSPANN